jgi:hypothetical protein
MSVCEMQEQVAIAAREHEWARLHMEEALATVAPHLVVVRLRSRRDVDRWVAAHALT